MDDETYYFRAESRLIESANDSVEYFDDWKTLQSHVRSTWKFNLLTLKVEKTVALIKSSNSLIIFTGAGASVTAGIGTYRGTPNCFPQSVHFFQGCGE